MHNKIMRFVIWICSKFNRNQIEQIVQELLKILSNKNTDIKPKDSFQEEHPNYRKFHVDPNMPLSSKNIKKNKS